MICKTGLLVQYFIITGEMFSNVLSYHFMPVCSKKLTMHETCLHKSCTCIVHVHLHTKSYLHMKVQGTCCVHIGTFSADFARWGKTFANCHCAKSL